MKDKPKKARHSVSDQKVKSRFAWQSYRLNQYKPSKDAQNNSIQSLWKS